MLTTHQDQEGTGRHHISHQMQITSYFTYFPKSGEEEFNQVFRQETKRKIIMLLQLNDDMTDRELAFEMGHADPNKVRPRRNELMKEGIVEESCKRICAVSLKSEPKLAIAWKLSKEKLLFYIQNCGTPRGKESD